MRNGDRTAIDGERRTNKGLSVIDNAVEIEVWGTQGTMNGPTNAAEVEDCRNRYEDCRNGDGHCVYTVIIH